MFNMKRLGICWNKFVQVCTGGHDSKIQLGNVFEEAILESNHLVAIFLKT